MQVPDSAADADYVVEVVIGEEEGEGRELACRLEDWYCCFADSSKRGRMVPGPFDPNPEIKKVQRTVMKKLTDGELLAYCCFMQKVGAHDFPSPLRSCRPYGGHQTRQSHSPYYRHHQRRRRPM